MYGSPSPSLKFASGVGRVSRMAEATLSENIIRPKSVPPPKLPPPPSPPSPQLCRTGLSKHAKCGRVQRDSDVAGHDTRQIRIRQILKWTGAAAGMRAYAHTPPLRGEICEMGWEDPLARPISDRMANCDLVRPFNVRGCGEKYQGQRRRHFSSNAKGDARN